MLAIWALLAVAGGSGLLVASATPRGRDWIRHTLGWNGRQAIMGAWVTALIAMLGSLYFSSGVGFVPCLLCWYQRIMMYPLVLVLGVALLLRDNTVWRVTILLPLIGLCIATYHSVLQLRPSLEIVACDAGVPCSGRYVAVFGFVSIPVLAGSAFLLITSLLVAAAIAEGGVEEELEEDADDAADRV
jgi:disulfide bond formation protein DsbB